jgi:hypothetical protein
VQFPPETAHGYQESDKRDQSGGPISAPLVIASFVRFDQRDHQQYRRRDDQQRQGESEACYEGCLVAVG